MPSFDVVNTIEMMEVDNAISQSNKEVTQRFDFKGSNTTIERKEKEITIDSADDYKVQATLEVLQSKFAKRNVPLKVLKTLPIEKASGGRARQKIQLQEGIDTERAKEIVKVIKEKKLKVQASIQGESVRVTGKNKDDLQEVMAVLRALEFPLPLQFDNFRD